MHVDGFRFDLASVLGREDGFFRASAAFFEAISQDPLLNRVKLIAEPWDIGTYQVGNFPIDWSEWNGKFRDTVRKFGKGGAGQVRDLGWKLTGSADLYGNDGRFAYNSINFITCHDGFMRTQKGNNNAYCQDNELSWFDWRLVTRHADMVEFVKKAIALGKRFSVLRRRKFLLGEDLDTDNVPDITWYGFNLDAPAWDDPELRTLCYRLEDCETDPRNGGYHVFFILNGDWREQGVKLPTFADGKRWYGVIDTSLPSGEDFSTEGAEVMIDPPEYYIANPRSTVVLLAK